MLAIVNSLFIIFNCKSLFVKHFKYIVYQYTDRQSWKNQICIYTVIENVTTRMYTKTHTTNIQIVATMTTIITTYHSCSYFFVILSNLQQNSKGRKKKLNWKRRKSSFLKDKKKIKKNPEKTFVKQTIVTDNKNVQFFVYSFVAVVVSSYCYYKRCKYYKTFQKIYKGKSKKNIEAKLKW